MATSGTYVTEVPLKGTAEKHYKRWRNENHAFPDAVGHHIQSVTVHDGEWDSHGAIKIWNYTLTNKQYVNLEKMLEIYCIHGKQEVFKERREIDDEKKTVTFRGLGRVIVCKITFNWEKRNDDFPDPSNYMKFIKSLAADMDDHVIKA
ncbi:hypothetical protein HID58_041586 [Brassica napus]|uniref:Bet v I/Major latex protein domain-containing protein n=1 Tax=Brassica napus TaxID=3708 RepID=A0ABQ8BBJ4_BRANA|nr:hypothetical protein HID58_041586 [Brassica napus]